MSYFHLVLFFSAIDLSPQPLLQFFLLSPRVRSNVFPHAAQTIVTRGALRTSEAIRMSVALQWFEQQSCLRCLGWNVPPQALQVAGGILQTRHWLALVPRVRLHTALQVLQVAHSDLAPNCGCCSSLGFISPALIAARTRLAASANRQALSSSVGVTVPKSYSLVRAGRLQNG